MFLRDLKRLKTKSIEHLIIPQEVPNILELIEGLNVGSLEVEGKYKIEYPLKEDQV